jgi:hypothetical protein
METAAELAREVDFLKDRIQHIEQALGDLARVKVNINTAQVGDVLEDGSIVVTKSGGMSLVAGPSSTEVECPWSKEFSDVFEKLKDNGFNPSQWFIPSLEQLKMASYSQEVKKHFSTERNYWSSDEATRTAAKLFNFGLNGEFRHTKNLSYLCRPFRLLTY